MCDLANLQKLANAQIEVTLFSKVLPLLADGVPTVGWGTTFWRVGRVPSRKRA